MPTASKRFMLVITQMLEIFQAGVCGYTNIKHFSKCEDKRTSVICYFVWFPAHHYWFTLV